METRWWVYTPPHNHYSSGYYDPAEYGSDVVQVEAESRKEALVLGLRELRRTHSDWVRDMESDLRNPFNGLKAERYGEEETDDN